MAEFFERREEVVKRISLLWKLEVIYLFLAVPTYVIIFRALGLPLTDVPVILNIPLIPVIFGVLWVVIGELLIFRPLRKKAAEELKRPFG